MMPLCTTTTRPLSSVCGWALRSAGAPWVAQRVWAMACGEAGRALLASSFSSSAILPILRRTSMPSLLRTATPAES